jgi:hypothetical protein
MKRYLLLPLLFFLMANAFPQEPEEKTDETIYSFVPQYLINRGIRVDIEKQLKPRQLLQICPQFYLSEKDEDNSLQDKNQFSYLIGVGLNVYHKIFAFEEYKKYGLYLSYGISYNYFNIEYIDHSGDFDVSAKGNIHKAGGDLVLGYQFFVHEIVSVDVFTGLGTRVSYMDAGGADTDRFNTGYYGYNYTGNIMLLGLRIGVIL